MPQPATSPESFPLHVRMMEETARVGAWEADLGAGRVSCGGGLCRMLGLSSHEAPQDLDAWLARAHPDDRSGAAAAFASAGPTDLEYRIEGADGDWLWVRSRGGVVERDTEGRPLRIAGVLMDITERKTAERVQRVTLTFAQRLADEPDRATLCAEILQAALDLAGFEGGGLYWRDADGGYSLVAHRGLSEEFTRAVTRVEPDNRRADIIRAGRIVCEVLPTSLNHPPVELLEQPALRTEELGALVVMPLRVGGEPMASLNLASRQARPLALSGLTGLETLTALFTQALERLAAREEAARHALELARTTEALEREREFLRTVLRAMPDLVWLKDPDGRYLAVNARFEALYGHPEAEILGRDDYAFAPPELAEFFRSNDRAAVALGRARVNEETLTFASDGHREEIETIKTPLYADDGTLIGVLGVGRDITARRRAEETIRDNEELFRAIFRNAGDGIVLADGATSRIVQFNDAACEGLGYTREELARLRLPQIDPLIQQRVSDGPDERIDPGGRADFVTKHRHKDGSLRDRRITVSSIQLKGETYFLGIWRDITEELRAAQRVRESEELYRAIVTQAGDGIVVLDPETQRIVEFNDAACANLGYTREEFAVLKMPDINPLKDRNSAAETFAGLVSGQMSDFDTIHRTKSGEDRETRVTNRPVQIGGRTYVAAIWHDVTEERRTRQQLAESEELYRAIVSQAGDGILLIDPETGTLVELNDAAATSLGYTRDELLRLRIGDLNPHYSHEAAIARLRQMVADGTGDFDTQHRHKSGEWREVRVSNRPVRLKDRTYLAAVWRDMTEERRAAYELARSREQLQLALEGSGMGLWDWHVQTGETEFNDRWAEICGYRLDELAPVSVDTWIELTHPDDLRRATEELQRHFRGESDTYECELRMRHKEGRWIWIQDRGKVVERSENGRPLRMAGTHMDIDARKSAEAELLASEERFRTLFDAATVGMLVQDIDSGAMLQCNAGGLAILHYDSVQEMEKSWAEPPYSLDDALVMMRRAVEEGPQRFEWIGRTGDGSRCWIDVSLSAIRLDGIPRVLAVFHDITARKHGELLIAVERDFARCLTDELDRASLLETILATTLRLPGIDVGAIYRADTQGNITVLARQGVSDRLLKTLAPSSGASAEALLDRRQRYSCLRRSECSTDPGWVREVSEEGVQNVLMQPIGGWGTAHTGLVLAGMRHPEIDPIVRSGLETMAIQFGQALERLEHREEIERQRINRDELHRALEHSEALYRTTVEAISEGVLVVEGGERVLNYNRRFLDLWRIPDSLAAMGDDKALLVHVLDAVEDADAFLREVLRLYRGDESRLDEVRLKDGRVFQRYTAPLDFRGRRARIWTFNDITERNRIGAELERYRHRLEALVAERTRDLEEANRRLRLSDSRLTALFEIAQRAQTLSEQEILRLGVQEALRLSGSPQGYFYTVDGKRPQLLAVGCPDAEAGLCPAVSGQPEVASVLWGEAWRSGRAQVRNRGTGPCGPRGHELVRDVAVPVIEGDEVRGVLGVAGKPTEYDDAELHELQLVADDLWRILLRRRAEAALAEAKAEAEAANRAKSAFLANMSHEIRTPLNAITGHAHLAQRSSPDPAVRERMGKINVAAGQLVSIIDDILDISKIESGKLSLEAVDMELDPLLADVVTLLGERAAAKRLDLSIALDPRLRGTLRGDPLRIGQILSNFVSNAIKFTDRGQIRLRAKWIEERADRLTVRFEVEDTGIGIPEGDRERLFGAFEQQDVSISRLYGGTGLGLTISRRLAQLMGGTIGLESAPGRGSLFYCEIPLMRRSPAPPPPLSGMRALLIEPEAHDRDGLASTLEGFGMRVASFPSIAEAGAGSGAEGEGEVCADWLIARLGDSIPDLDLHFGARLPPNRLAIPPTVAMTHHDRHVWRELARAGGFRSFIDIPFAPSRLLDVVQAEDTPAAGRQGVGRLIAAPASDKPKVLLAEDNEINQEVALDLLQAAGAEVDLAENGEVAVQMAAARRYDLIFMDIQMPRLDGLEAARRIRKQEGGARTPIVAMTANAYEDDRRRALAAGMDDHLPKPVEPTKLYSCLLKWLPEKREHLSPPAPENGDDHAWPGALPGIDSRLGLELANGDPLRYFRRLKRFRSDQAATLDEMGEQLHERLAIDPNQELKRLIHDVISAAGLIGAASASRQAAELQRAIHDRVGLATLRGMAEALKAELATVAAAIDGLPAPRAADSEVETSVDSAGALGLIADLYRLLEANDTEASRLLRRHGAVLKQVMGHRWPDLQARIERYDFQRAREIVQEWQRSTDGSDSPVESE